MVVRGDSEARTRSGHGAGVVGCLAKKVLELIEGAAERQRGADE